MKASVYSIFIIQWSFIFFCKPLFYRSTFICNNQSTVIRMAVGMSKKCYKTAVLLVILNKPVKVYIKHCISIEKKKILSQFIFNFEQCPRIAKRLFFKIVVNMYAKRLARYRRVSRAITKVIHDNISQMAYCNNDVIKTLFFKAFNFSFQYGNALNLYHRLWNVTRH